MSLLHNEIPLLFDDLTGGLWDLDIANNRVSLSPNASKLFGHVRPVILRCEEVLNTSIHEDYKDRLKDQIGQLLGNRIDSIDTEIKVRSSNNDWKWVHFSGKAISRNQDGSPNRVIGSIREIPEQEGFPQDKPEPETYYQTLVNISPNGVIVTDEEGKVSFISKKAYQIFKIPEGENCIGHSIFKRVALDNLATAKSNFREVLEAKVPKKSQKYLCLDYYDSEIWMDVSYSPLLDFSGKSRGLMVVGSDITDLKKMEEDLVSAKMKAAENDKLKTAFLQSISHEIRTPLNAIVGFSSLLDDHNLSKDQQKTYIDTILENSDHLLEIISEILEMSHMDAGIVQVNENKFDLNELLDDLFNHFNRYSERTDIQLIPSKSSKDEKRMISSDRTKVFQILSNLLSNAFKFTESGIIKFGYTAEENSIQFYVSDTGKGVPDEEFHKIFDRFYQVENSGTRINEGTGLGLSICKAYVELLGGRIWLTSRVGEGSTFYFTIPINRNKTPLKSI